MQGSAEHAGVAAERTAERPLLPPQLMAALVLLSGLLLTLVLWDWSRDNERQDGQAHFDRLAERIETELLRRLHLPTYGIHGARGVYAASANVSLEEFRAYVEARQPAQEFPGVRGFGFIERVMRADAPRFVARMRVELGPDFELRGGEASGAPDHYVIKYIEPLAANRAAWGLDLGAEAVRRAAIERAVHSGETTLSGRIALVQDAQRSPGFLLLAPVYRRGADPRTPEQRERALLGLVYAPLVAREILDGLARVAEGLLDVQVFVGNEARPEALVYASHPGGAARRQFESLRPLDFGGTRLLLRIGSLPGFERQAALHGAGWLAGTGVLLSLLLALAVWLLGTGRARALRLAGQMTAELDRLAHVARATTNAVFSTDPEQRITWVNEGFTRLTGYSAAEALGRTPGALLGSGRADPAVLRQLQEAVQAGRGCRVEILNRRKDGSLYWVDTELQPLHDRRGRLSGFIEISLDISERKRSAELLWQERERLNSIIEGTQAGTWEWNVQTDAVRFNERWAGMLGYRLAELEPLGLHTWVQRAHPDDLALSEQLLQRHLRGEIDHYQAEVRLRHRDGHWVWVLTSGKLYAYTAEGEPLSVAGIHLDITERKRMEQELRASEAVLERTGRIAGVGGWQLDLRTMQLRWTDQTFRIHDLPPQRQPGAEDALAYYDLPARLAIKAALKRAIRRRESADLELRLTTALGRQIWVRAVGEPVFEGRRAVRVDGTLQDITERRTLEDSMRRANQVLRSVLDNLPCALSVFDADLRLLAHNQEFRRLLDFPDRLFEGGTTDFERLIRFNAERGEYGEGADVDATVAAIIERARAPGTHQFERVRPDGTALEVRGAPMPGGGFVTTYTDISARKRLEAEQQRSSELMRVMLENLPCGLTMFDAQMRLILSNSRYAQMYELDEAFLADQPVTVEKVTLLMQRRREYGEISTAQALAAAYERARSAMQAPHFWERQRPGGPLLEMRSAPLPGGGFVTTYTDVTEQRRAAAELTQTLTLLKAVLASSSKVAIIATDRQRRISVFNRGAEQMLGYGAEELIGHQGTAILHVAEDLEAYAQQVSAELGQPLDWRAALTHPSQLGREIECRYRRKDGSEFPALRVITEMRDGEGVLHGYLGVAFDITRQKEVEASLQAARDAAEQASLAKSQFLANMSHEIRTPMNAILGMLRLLQRTSLDPRQRDYAGKAEGAARSLLALLNDILDFSKIEAGKLSLDPQPFRPAGLLENLRVILEASLDGRPLALRFELDPALPEALQGDALRLQQVLINLGGNAIKFTEAGGVTVSLSQLARQGDAVLLECRVSDSGIGIAPEHQQKIFADFTQAEASTTRRFGGTGLGLAISQQLVQLMGGRIELRSAPGQGSDFFFRLWLPAVEAAALPAAGAGRVWPGRRLQGLRLLLVEDNPNNQQVARELLEDEGATLVLAGDGRQALELLARDARFDAVLMDVQMPVMDGHAATRAIRADPALAGLPVIAMTANALEADLQACREAGMDAHVGKPFELDHLVGVIARLSGRPVAPAVAQGVAPPPAPADLDLDGALQRLMGKTALLARLSRSFAEGARDLPLRLRELLAQGQARPAAEALHSFRGLAATLGANRLAALAREGEQGLKVGQMPAPDWLERLAQAIGQDCEALLEFAAGVPAGPAAADIGPAPNAAALGAGLQALMALLRGSDMAALEALEQLRDQGLERALAAPARATLEALAESMAQLDFGRALQYCEQLSGELSGEPSR